MADTQTLKGLDDVMRKLEALPKEISGKNGGPVRKALRKGAVVIAKQAKANVRRIVAEPNADGRVGPSTGNLEKAIGVVKMRRPHSGAKEGFLVMVRGAVMKKYANNRRNRSKRRVFKLYKTEGPSEYYGRMLETGTERMRPHPWLKPAFMLKRHEALNTVVKELDAGIERIVRKLSRGI